MHENIFSPDVKAGGTRDEDILLFEGRMEGVIREPKGSRHYAWDPCFVPMGHDCSYAEMPKETKNSLSHYRRAIEKIRSFFLGQP